MHRRSALTGALWAGASYALAIVLSLVLMVLVLRLWHADLTIPFYHDSDALLTQMWVKGIIENGWYLDNDALGAPAGLHMADFPQVDSVHFLLLKLLTGFTSSAPVVCNLYFLLGFPLITLSALFVLRRLGASYWPALLGSLLYTFLPFHLDRGGWHLFLGAYYQVPLAILLILWVYRGNPALFVGRTAEGRLRLRPLSGASLGSLAFCLLVSSAGVYYAFFTCLLLGVAGLAGAVARRVFHPLAISSLLIATIALGALANLIPTIRYQRQHGQNPAAVARSVSDADLYGLKITQLLLPVDGHYLSPLASFKDAYNRDGLYINENRSATLGVLGGLGFLFLIGRFVVRGPGRPFNDLLDGLGIANLAAVLLGTVGGLGPLLSSCGLIWIRAYNRISIFIAFFALAALVLIAEALRQRYVYSRRRAVLFVGLLGLLLALGLVDQTSRRYVPAYQVSARIWRTDAEFVQRLEASLPARAMILQLPYRPFPECPPTHALGDYDQLRPYLHSRTLRWSYAVMKGRDDDLWQRWLAGFPLAELTEKAALAGFAGIWVDRAGIKEDQRDHLEARLSELVGTQPQRSQDGRHAFFPLTGYVQRLRQRLPEATWQARREQALRPITLDWQNGFWPPEGDCDYPVRWCRADGLAMLNNPTPRPRKVILELVLRGDTEQPLPLAVESSLFHGSLDVTTTSATLTRLVTVPPGHHSVTFHCPTPSPPSPLDGRGRAFAVEHWRVSEVEE